MFKFDIFHSSSKLLFTGFIFLFAFYLYSIWVVIPRADTLVGGLDSAYNMHLSPMGFWEDITSHWSHRGVGYRFFSYMIVGLIRIFIPSYMTLGLDPLSKIRIFFIAHALLYQLITAFSVYLARKKIKSVDFSPFVVFIVASIILFCSRNEIGQPEILSIVFIYLYLGMTLSDNKYLELLSGVMVLPVTTLKGITGIYFMLPGVFLLYCFYLKKISSQTLLRVIISGFIGVLCILSFYFYIYPRELESLVQGSQRYGHNTDSGAIGYVKRVIDGILKTLPIGIIFTGYAVSCHFIIPKLGKMRFLIIHLLIVTVGLIGLKLINKIDTLPFTLFIYIISIYMSGIFFYQKNYLPFALFFLLYLLSRSSGDIQGVNFPYHYSTQGLVYLYLVLISIPTIQEFFKDYRLKNAGIYVLAVFLFLSSVWTLRLKNNPSHGYYYGYYIPSGTLINDISSFYPDIKTQKELLAYGRGGENFYTGIYNPSHFNQCYRDLVAPYTQDSFFQPYRDNMINYSGKYMIFIFSKDENNAEADQVKDWLNQVFINQPNEAVKILSKYKNITNITSTNSDLKLFLYAKES